MKVLLGLLIILSALPALADNRVGKWCELADDGESCVGYISYFANGDVYAYGNIENLLYTASGFWQQHDTKSCLNLTYKVFHVITEEPLPPEDSNFCNTIVAITDNNFTYVDESGVEQTMKRYSHQPDFSKQPLPETLIAKQQTIKPITLELDTKPGQYGVMSLPNEAAPNQVRFSLHFSPYPEQEAANIIPYVYVQVGESDSSHLRVSLHYKKEYGDKAALMLEYHTPGAAAKRQLLANDVTINSKIEVTLGWTPEGQTTVSYKGIETQHFLPLSNWAGYFIASSAQAEYQRQP